ncbi:SIS domain-containing protein [Anoxynatronum sibiricum]|uniref:SIS domain-containing protein n=1 Tax=Anoxynatronum sibiricum TaxID=210623 RepID=A0ABU9W0X8_9CLOT
MIDYFEKTIHTISNSISSVDAKKFEILLNTLEEKLNAGGKIIASGLGKNVPICEKFIGTLNSLGINAVFLNTHTALHGDLGVIKENDIVLLLTKSGNTEESILLANHLLERKAEIWLISFNRNSKLIKLLNHSIILDLESEGDGWDIIPNNSTSVYLILLQGLAMMLRDRMNISLKEFKNNHPAGSIGETLRELK